MLYKDIKETNQYKRDTNCCTVVASSVAFNQKFEHTQNYYSTNGRRRGRGLDHWTSIRLINKYAVQVGGSVEVINPKTLTGGATMTVNNSKKYLDKTKNYIMFSRGHAIGVKNGVVEDWSKGTKRPIRELYCITPPKGFGSYLPTEEVLQPRKLMSALDQALELLN